MGKWKCCRLVVSDSLGSHGLQPARLLCPWIFPGKNTRVGCHLLLHGVFPIHGLNPCFLLCRQILYHLSHQESPHMCPTLYQIYPSHSQLRTFFPTLLRRLSHWVERVSWLLSNITPASFWLLESVPIPGLDCFQQKALMSTSVWLF